MSTKVAPWLYEKRPIKRHKSLGAADVYRQEPRQKEDELTAINVKQGFQGITTIQDEYGSARNTGINSNKFGAFYSALLAKKHELNTLSDSARRRQQLTKDNIWFVTPRDKPAVDSWFKDLAAGTKTLNQLLSRKGRSVPYFNKKEEVLVRLQEVQVPVFKAAWFIKMSSSYTLAIQETGNKSKKRNQYDPSQEWTQALTKHMYDLYQKLSDHYHNLPMGSSNPGGGVGGGHGTSFETTMKHWTYFVSLTRHLFEENLLERFELLSWIIDLFERVKSPDDQILNLLTPLLIQYAEDFTDYELLSRRLAHHSAKKINQLVNEYVHNAATLSSTTSSNGPSSTASILSPSPKPGATDGHTPSSANASSQPDGTGSKAPASSNNLHHPHQLVYQSFNEMLNCTQHRKVLLCLSSLLQMITLKCPTALVWHHIDNVKGKPGGSLNGSPLDYLPCPTSCLPMPRKQSNYELRQHLRNMEQEICLRSKAVENKWTVTDNCTQTASKSHSSSSSSASSSTSAGSISGPKATSGTMINKLLVILDALDRYNFDRIDPSQQNTLEDLYKKIFLPLTAIPGALSDSGEARNIQVVVSADEPIVKLLCEWAITTKRNGEHRGLVVAKLLERRQSELIIDKDVDMMDFDGADAESKITSTTTSYVPVYQTLLTHFLDTQAPLLDDRAPSFDNRVSFSNLVLLFGELIRNEIFSHDVYLCQLISRGYFLSTPLCSTTTSPAEENVKPNGGSTPSLTGLVPPLHAIGSNVSTGPHSSGEPGARQSESSLPMFDIDNSNNGAADRNPTGLSWDLGPKPGGHDMDDAGIDADLEKLLNHIKEGQQNNMHDHTDILLPDPMNAKSEANGNVKKDPDADPHTTSANGAPTPGATTGDQNSKTLAQRHLLYTTHFPLPQDETNHDSNQRHILLYGVGKARDDARHAVKRVTKDVMKLFSRKSSMDISEGGKVKKPATKEGFTFEGALQRFQALSFFDQSYVTNVCAQSAVEMLNGVATGTANYLPCIESIAFLFDLMEMAQNVHGLIDFNVQMLRELVEVENQLIQKCIHLAGSYCTSIGLYIVGVLYRYQSSLLVSEDEIVAVFEGLFKLVKHVVNPFDCLSAERCIMTYLYDLYSSCAPLRAKYHDFAPYSEKIKRMICSGTTPRNQSLLCNNTFMTEYINNPKLKFEISHFRQLNENQVQRYSFVCNAVKAVAMARDPNYINELSILCAELSSHCPSLSSEWIAVMKALCCSSDPACAYLDVVTFIKVSDTSIHDNLAILTSILVARRCFSLEDFVVNCALPSLLAACPVLGGNDDSAKPGARLTCHLLLCLFKTSDPPLSSSSAVTSTPATTLYSLSSPGPNSLTPPPIIKRSYVIKHPCDKYLLAAAHGSMRVEAVVAVLKAILVLGDSEKKSEVSVSDLLEPIDDDDFGFPPNIFGTPLRSANPGIEHASLGDFAKHVLKQICGQNWVFDKCLGEPEMLCRPDMFLDTMLGQKQAQRLLQMICYPRTTSAQSLLEQENSNHKSYIIKILSNLDEWSLHISWLQLELVHAQCNQSGNTTPQSHHSHQPQHNVQVSEAHAWLDTIAKVTIDFFQAAAEEQSRLMQPSAAAPQTVTSSGAKGKGGSKSQQLKAEKHHQQMMADAQMAGNSDNKERIWLIAPLIAKLHPLLQGKILKFAAAVLETGNWMCPTPPPSNSKSKDRNFQQPKVTGQSSTSQLLSFQPFLSLLLMCLRGGEDQRDQLLRSLYSQLNQAVDERPNDELKTKLVIQDGLQLRLSLVGSMFDSMQRSYNVLSEWAELLLQLICNAVVEPQLNYDLFSTVLDMLAVLIHSTQAADIGNDGRDSDSRGKNFFNLMKKLRKVIPSDRTSIGIEIAKQLLPLSKSQTDVITCEPMGSLIDTKGNKIAGFDSIDKKQGLQVAEKQKVSPWDLLEGHKNPAPLNWSWFGAVRYERKPTRPEDNCHSMQWHTHTLRKPTEYFLEPPPSGPEDVEPDPVPTPVAPAPEQQLGKQSTPQPVAMGGPQTPGPIPSVPTPQHPPSQPTPPQQPSQVPLIPPQQMPPQVLPGMPPQSQTPTLPGLIGLPLPEDIKRESNTPSDVSSSSPRATKATKPKTQRRRKTQVKTPPIQNLPPEAQQGPPPMGGMQRPFENFGSGPVGPGMQNSTPPIQQQQPNWFQQQQGPPGGPGGPMNPNMMNQNHPGGPMPGSMGPGGPMQPGMNQMGGPGGPVPVQGPPQHQQFFTNQPGPQMQGPPQRGFAPDQPMPQRANGATKQQLQTMLRGRQSGQNPRQRAPPPEQQMYQQGPHGPRQVRPGQMGPGQPQMMPQNPNEARMRMMGPRTMQPQQQQYQMQQGPGGPQMGGPGGPQMGGPGGPQMSGPGGPQQPPQWAQRGPGPQMMAQQGPQPNHHQQQMQQNFMQQQQQQRMMVSQQMGPGQMQQQQWAQQQQQQQMGPGPTRMQFQQRYGQQQPDFNMDYQQQPNNNYFQQQYQ